MKRGLKKTLKISGIVLGAAFLLIVAAVLVAVFDKPLVRGLVLKQLNKGVGTTARLGRLDYTVFPFRVTVDSLDLGQEDAFQKLGVSLPRFEARGSLWKILRGDRPAFDVLEARGLVVRLEQKAVSEAPLDLEKVLLQVSDALAWTRRISLKDAELAISLLGGRTEVKNLDLALTPGPAKEVLGYEISRAELALRDKSGAILLAAGLNSSGRVSLASPYTIECSFDLQKARWTLAGAADSLEALSLAVTGRFDKPAQKLTISRFELRAPGLLGVEGQAEGHLGSELAVQAGASAKLESLTAAAAHLKPLLPPELRDSPWRGRAELAGKYTVHRTGQSSKDELAVTLSLDGVEIAPAVSGRQLPIRAAGRIDVAGPSSDPRVSADLRTNLGRVTASGLTVGATDLHLVGSGSLAGAEIALLDAQVSAVAYEASPGQRIAFDRAALVAKGHVDLAGQKAELTSLDVQLSGLALDAAAGKRVAFDKAALSATGSFDLARKQGALTSLEARLPGLAPVRLSGRYGLDPAAPAELKAEVHGLDLPTLRKIAGPFVPADFGAWDLAGSLDLALAASRPAGARSDWHVAGTAALAGLKFNDPTFTIAGDGLNPVLKIEGTGSPAKGFSFSANLETSQGESLLKSVYVTWSKNPLRLTASGRYDPTTGAIDGLTARVALPPVGTIDLRGAARLSPAPAIDLAAEAALSLGPLYSLYSQAGVAEAARTKLEGTLGASLSIRKTPDALSIGGRIKLADANVELPGSETLLLGLVADVPILYDSRPAAAASGPAPPLSEAGRFHIGEMQSPFLTLKPIDIALRSGANALGFEPLSLPMFGGRLDLGATTFRLDPATGAIRGLGSLALKDIDISQFPIQSPQFKLTGKIQADFPRLDIGTDKIAIEGRGEASVFGGKIVLRDLAVTEPFAANRLISLDIDLLDLDMKKVTDEVPFGEVTGIVRGEVRGLVISYGQPESFNFRIESVPRKGVARTFSLKAVDNLTVLSSGQKASGGTSSFWMKFVRGFRYQKLGIVSTLRNDTFTLNGTIHEGGTEYLVKKPALFGISVVNKDPTRKVSFKEMTGRLKRIGQ